MNKQKALRKQRTNRRFRVRKRFRGDETRPRMSIFRSHQHIGCQLIDDAGRKTLVSASTRDKDLSGSISYGGNADAAAAVGKAVAEKALAAGIKTVSFDRGSYKYHGRVAALADAAREAGLSF